MWLLVSVSDNDVSYPILGDHKYVVGRQSCDIVIPDASVSRKQAVLTMAHYETSVVKSYITPTLTLEDVSKFGTFVNGKAVKNPGGSTVTLKHNDEIKFGGSPTSVFKAVYEPFVATTSCLEKAPKKSLLKVMGLLGGHLVRDWRPICDLLIMSKINVTIKVICAINNQKHIVTPQYLDDLHSHLMGRREKPDPISYLPEVVDQEVPMGVSFHPDIRRMTLLQGLKFYFLSAVQFNKTNLAVSTAGGQPILLEDGTEEEAEAMTEDKTVVVAVSREVLATLSPSCQKFVKLVISVLKRKNLRMVTDPEIGWAILTCNTVDFCNARSSITPDMLSYMAIQSISQSTEVDTSHSVQPVDVKPVNRSIINDQNKNTSLADDIKLPTSSIKPEMVSPDSKKQTVKTEPLEEHFEVKQTEDVVISSEASQRKRGLSNKSSIPPAQRTSVSDTVIPALKQREEDSIKRGKEILNSHPRGSQSDVSTNSDAGKIQRRVNEDDNPDETVSVFARRQVKLQLKSRVKNLEDSDDDLAGSRKQRASKRKPLNLFGDDEDDDAEASMSKRMRTDQKERDKQQRDANSDVFVLNSNIYDDAEAGLSKRRRTDQEGGGKQQRAANSDVFVLSSNSDDDSVAGMSKQKRNIQVERNKQNRDASSDAFVLSNNFDEDGVSGTQLAAVQDSPDVVTKSRDKSGQDQSHALGSSCGAPQEVTSLPALSGDGWLNMRTVKAKQNGDLDAAQNGGADEDVKPNTELLRDGEGKLLRNLCQIEVTELISRPAVSKVKSAPQRSNGQGEKNFKKFKKTQHAGAGRLPIIIGGRDLEVYTGSKHKDIEDLFSAGLAQENKRQEDERRERDLFNWDDRTRKASSKRIR